MKKLEYLNPSIVLISSSLLLASTVLSGCVATDIVYGYALAGNKSKDPEEMLVGTVELTRPELTSFIVDQDKIMLNFMPLTAIDMGKKQVKLIDDTVDVTVYKEPYSLRIRDNGIYGAVIIEKLLLHIGHNTVNLKEKVSSIEYRSFHRKPYPSREKVDYTYTKEDLEQFYKDGSISMPEGVEHGNRFWFVVVTEDLDISYSKVASFTLDMDVKIRHKETQDERTYPLKLKFHRKKMVVRPPWFAIWFFKTVFSLNGL